MKRKRKKHSVIDVARSCRKLMRSVARANMLADGYEQINRKRKPTGKSLFSMYWRKFVFR